MPDEIFDLDAVAAEAEGQPFEFTFRDEKWSIAHIKSFGRNVKRLLANVDDDDKAVDIMLSKGMGEDRYRRWQELDPGVGTESALFDAWLEHCGVSRGNSESSAGSSPSTAGPSKRASKPRTKSASRASSTARSPRAKP